MILILAYWVVELQGLQLLQALLSLGPKLS
jgi:hypothetical protein